EVLRPQDGASVSRRPPPGGRPGDDSATIPPYRARSADAGDGPAGLGGRRPCPRGAGAVTGDNRFMSVSADVLRTHLDYTAWASQLLVDAAAQLSPEELDRDFKTADRNVLNTLVHIYAADRLWLARLSGGPHPGFITDSDRSLSVLQKDW